MFIHSEGALCHAHAHMAKMPTKEDKMWPLTGMDMTSGKCSSSEGKAQWLSCKTSRPTPH